MIKTDCRCAAFDDITRQILSILLTKCHVCNKYIHTAMFAMNIYMFRIKFIYLLRKILFTFNSPFSEKRR